MPSPMSHARAPPFVELILPAQPGAWTRPERPDIVFDFTHRQVHLCMWSFCLYTLTARCHMLWAHPRAFYQLYVSFLMAPFCDAACRENLALQRVACCLKRKRLSLNSIHAFRGQRRPPARCCTHVCLRLYSRIAVAASDLFSSIFLPAAGTPDICAATQQSCPPDDSWREGTRTYFHFALPLSH